MDPLRCGAGEAGAFHHLLDALQTIRAKTVCASVAVSRPPGKTGLGGCYFDVSNLRR
jgi:hypothetical protein